MNLTALEALFRADIKDAATPYLFSQAQVWAWLNEAEREACLRADLIFDEATAAVCQVAVTAGTASYTLHAKITRVAYATFLATGASAEDRVVLELVDRIELTRRRPHWRTETEEPRELIVEQRKARFGCIPQDDGTLALECYRLPLNDMAAADAEPEIGAAHHLGLVQWAKYRAYLVPDTETYDEAAAERALAEFERIFGLRPDADLRQATEAVPQFNKVYLP